MKTNLETMNTPDRNALMGVSMKLKQGLAAIILAIATFSAHATPQTGYYIYDESGHLIGEYDADGNTVQEHIYLGDRPVAVVQGQGGSVGYVTTDQLNTPRVVTDSSQAIEWSWTSDPFGNGQPTGSLTYNLRFPGQYYDAETGHNYNMFRDYDPSTGRYIESDPIGLLGGDDTYAYASADPVSRKDPQGLYNYNYYSSEQDDALGWTICDGLGNIIAYLVPDLDPCIAGCVRAHENVHVADLNRLGTGGCTGKRRGVTIGFANDFDDYASELRAYRTELHCLEAKRNSLPCDSKCKASIDNKINSVNNAIKHFNLLQNGHY